VNIDIALPSPYPFPVLNGHAFILEPYIDSAYGVHQGENLSDC